MSSDFQKLRTFLSAVNVDSDAANNFTKASYNRLINALKSASAPHPLGVADIARLIRYILRQESEIQGGAIQTLRVPKKHGWPNQDLWEKFGVSVIHGDDNSYVIEAQPWKPQWMNDVGNYPPEADAFAEKIRRKHAPVMGDPFLGVVNQKNYLNSGQRDAVRRIMNSPQNATLVVNLPTGSGKSLCAYLPALLRSQTFGVSVIIVPTTALALDLERSLAELIGHDTAYFSDSSEGGAARRSAIKDRIRNGKQRIVFTSPESLIDALAAPLYDAAKRGLIRVFAVDEAHTIDQWGDDFRSSFQVIPGLRRDLLRVAAVQGRNQTSFTTLLMSATITEQCLDTLQALFGDPGPFEVLSSVRVRPEPSYWFSKCESEEEREEKVMEAIRHLPGPLILYCTKVQDATRWGSLLRSREFKRLDVLTGKSSAGHRQQVIKNWQSQSTDIIVATSAFGLGIDQANVRTVIHACVPETIDRFYQEVGRGGRDGKASISLTIYTGEDLEVAAGLNQKTLIGIARGRERWNSMFAAKETLSDGRCRVPVNVTPSLRPGDIDMDNQWNQEWNIRTLNLMSRAGLILMDSELPPYQSHDADGDRTIDDSQKYIKDLQNYRESRFIRVIKNDHLSAETWRTKVELVRRRLIKDAENNLNFMEKALNGGECISKLFAEVYEVSAQNAPNPREPIAVARACGGCAYCRRNFISPYANALPSQIPVPETANFEINSSLKQFLLKDHLLAIFYSARQTKAERERWFGRLINWLVKQGVRNVVAPRELLENLYNMIGTNTDSIAFFYEFFDTATLMPAPTAIVHPGGSPIPLSYPLVKERQNNQMPLILVLPEDAMDPVSGHRRVKDIFNGSNYNLDEFCTEISL